MGNYIYGFIPLKSLIGNQTEKAHITAYAVKSVVEDIKSEVATNEAETDEVATNEVATNEVATNEVATNEVATNEVATNEVATNEEKSIHPSIHPYLLEYSTGVSNHMIINNNIYKYTKPN
jgi:hypothetical protein